MQPAGAAAQRPMQQHAADDERAEQRRRQSFTDMGVGSQLNLTAAL